MKNNSLKKQGGHYRTDEAKTPYMKAKKEWDDRIGGARVQAKNWRLIALILALVSLFLIIVLAMALGTRTTRVFVAEVTHSGRIVNVLPLQQAYEPTQAQTEYFVAHFVKLSRSLPLDPVVAKNRWETAYAFVSDNAVLILNQMFKELEPQKWLGKRTISIKVQDVNSISKNTYQVDWRETTVGIDGKLIKTATYNGVFTLTYKAPTTEPGILKNPLGIHIVNFHITTRED